MAEVLRSESDTDHRYRITRTDRGVLLSCMQKTEAGLLLGPAEWLYRTEEAVESGPRDGKEAYVDGRIFSRWSQDKEAAASRENPGRKPEAGPRARRPVN